MKDGGRGLTRFARQGGPNLVDDTAVFFQLADCYLPQFPAPKDTTRAIIVVASGGSSHQSRQIHSTKPTNVSTKSRIACSCSRAFQRHLIDHAIYPVLGEGRLCPGFNGEGRPGRCPKPCRGGGNDFSSEDLVFPATHLGVHLPPLSSYLKQKKERKNPSFPPDMRLHTQDKERKKLKKKKILCHSWLANSQVGDRLERTSARVLLQTCARVCRYLPKYLRHEYAFVVFFSKVFMFLWFYFRHFYFLRSPYLTKKKGGGGNNENFQKHHSTPGPHMVQS